MDEELLAIAYEGQAALAGFPLISLADDTAMRAQFAVALFRGTGLDLGDREQLAALVAEFVVARFGSDPESYVAKRLAQGWSPVSDEQIAAFGGEGTLLLLRGAVEGAGSDLGTAATVLRGMYDSPGGINQFVGMAVGDDVVLADAAASGAFPLLEGALGAYVWQGSIRQCGRAWMNPPSQLGADGELVRLAFVLESVSGWRSPFHVFAARSDHESGWSIVQCHRYNTPDDYACSDW